MLSRLLLSSLRQGNSSLINQNRNFRRPAPLTAASTVSSTTNPGIISTSIPGVKVSLTPGVKIVAKRAPSAYNLFVCEKSTDQKGKSAPEIMKETASQWKKLTDDERRRYELESTNLQTQYDDAFLRLSKEEFRRVVMEEMQRVQTKRVQALRRQQRELKSKYEYPQGGQDFTRLFAMAKDHREEFKNLPNAPTRGVRIGQMWRELPDDEKKAYEKRELAARTRYRKNVEAWEKKMKMQGLQSVVDTIKMRPMKSPIKIRRRSTSRKVLASKVARKKVEGKKMGRKTATKKGKKKVEKEE